MVKTSFFAKTISIFEFSAQNYHCTVGFVTIGKSSIFGLFHHQIPICYFTKPSCAVSQQERNTARWNFVRESVFLGAMPMLNFVQIGSVVEELEKNTKTFCPTCTSAIIGFVSTKGLSLKTGRNWGRLRNFLSPKKNWTQKKKWVQKNRTQKKNWVQKSWTQKEQMSLNNNSALHRTQTQASMTCRYSWFWWYKSAQMRMVARASLELMPGLT